ncbi:peptidylprolyl isomerase [Myceligenerans xiligouense]|uniref:Peptidyl-prolyl cis-trans isomerase B (Cyclophilin B) n=1 Tax=Myceligenerans xiligouense TaxID=253184 RepID=A0A3N4YP25_9MICO|nr:peptidylprolyl isomerase [Myceligenerans xiligouense]RPF21114.1 peptidyl-prolyl cis-trans isomerase B (cyclophilin B) [Myceligenerans xiligouense]
MSTSKQRQRAQQARKQQVRQEQRQAARRARRRRLTALVAGLAALALVATFVVAALVSTSPGEAATEGEQCEPGTTDAREGHELPGPEVAENRSWTVTLHACATGAAQDITLELDGAAAPQAVASFVTLAEDGYFDGTGCHRLTTAGIFVLQCGDPTFTGMGGPGYEFGPVENAPENGLYPAGTVAMARAGSPDSMGSQFFLVYEDSEIPSEDGYTVFGEITSGLDVVQAVADEGVAGQATDGEPAGPVTIEGVETQ